MKFNVVEVLVILFGKVKYHVLRCLPFCVDNAGMTSMEEPVGADSTKEPIA